MKKYTLDELRALNDHELWKENLKSDSWVTRIEAYRHCPEKFKEALKDREPCVRIEAYRHFFDKWEQALKDKALFIRVEAENMLAIRKRLLEKGEMR